MTERDLEIFELVIKGKSNREIARMLHISAHTVKAHLRSYFRKHDISNRTRLAYLLGKNNII